MEKFIRVPYMKNLFSVKRDRGLFHRGGLKRPSFFFPFFLFGVLMGFT
jgi:hypothetical protein